MDAQIVATMQKYEAERQQQYKTYLWMSFVGVALVVLAIVFGICGYQFSLTPFFFAAVFAAVAGFVLIGIGVSKKKKWVDGLLDSLSQEVNRKFFPDAVSKPALGFDYAFFAKPGFFAKPDRYNTDHYVSASYSGIPFQKAHYNLQKREQHTDGRGNTTVSYVTYAMGTMYRFDYQRDFGQTVKILEKAGRFDFAFSGLKKVETEYIEFNKKFQVLASDETLVFYLLTPQIQERIMGLEKLFKGQFYMAFIGGDLFIAVNDSDQSISIKMGQPLTEDVVEGLLMLLAIPKVFIDLLGINKDKFKNNAGANYDLSQPTPANAVASETAKPDDPK